MLQCEETQHATSALRLLLATLRSRSTTGAIPKSDPLSAPSATEASRQRWDEISALALTSSSFHEPLSFFSLLSAKIFREVRFFSLNLYFKLMGVPKKKKIKVLHRASRYHFRGFCAAWQMFWIFYTRWQLLRMWECYISIDYINSVRVTWWRLKKISCVCGCASRTGTSAPWLTRPVSTTPPLTPQTTPFLASVTSGVSSTLPPGPPKSRTALPAPVPPRPPTQRPRPVPLETGVENLTAPPGPDFPTPVSTLRSLTLDMLPRH